MNQQVADALAENPMFLITFFSSNLGFISIFYCLSWLLIRPKQSERGRLKLKKHLVPLFAAATLQTVCVLLFSLGENSIARTLFAILFSILAASYIRFSEKDDAEKQAKKAFNNVDDKIEKSFLANGKDERSQLKNTDDALFEKAMTECNGAQRKAGLWARCFAEAEGDENKTQALYIKHRAQELSQSEDNNNSTVKYLSTVADAYNGARINSTEAESSNCSRQENNTDSLGKERKWFFFGGIFLIIFLSTAIYMSSRPQASEDKGTKTSQTESAPTPNVAAPATQLIISSSKALDDETLTKIIGKPVMILTKEVATGFRDLDGDGVEDVFLTDASMECGNGGCTYRLIVSNNGVPKNIGEIEAKTIEALSATSNGLRDLKTVWQSGCVSNLFNVLKFDGVKYNLVKSYEEPGSCASEQSNKVISIGSTSVAPPPISSSNPRQLNQQAIVQIRNGQYKEAVMLLQEASSVAPQDSEILGNLGYALLMGGDPIRAEVVLKKALAIKPNRGSTLNNLGLALAAQGHEREAKDLFVRYVAASANKTAAFNQLQAWSTSPDASLPLRNAASEALSQTR